MENGVIYEGYVGRVPVEPAAAEDASLIALTSPVVVADKHAICHDDAGSTEAMTPLFVAGDIVKAGQSSPIKAVETSDPSNIAIDCRDYDIDAFVLPAPADKVAIALTLLPAMRDDDLLSLPDAGSAHTLSGLDDIPLTPMPDDTSHLAQQNDVWPRTCIHDQWG